MSDFLKNIIFGFIAEKEILLDIFNFPQIKANLWKFIVEIIFVIVYLKFKKLSKEFELLYMIWGKNIHLFLKRYFYEFKSSSTQRLLCIFWKCITSQPVTVKPWHWHWTWLWSNFKRIRWSFEVVRKSNLMGDCKWCIIFQVNKLVPYAIKLTKFEKVYFSFWKKDDTNGCKILNFSVDYTDKINHVILWKFQEDWKNFKNSNNFQKYKFLVHNIVKICGWNVFIKVSKHIFPDFKIFYI